MIIPKTIDCVVNKNNISLCARNIIEIKNRRSFYSQGQLNDGCYTKIGVENNFDGKLKIVGYGSDYQTSSLSPYAMALYLEHKDLGIKFCVSNISEFFSQSIITDSEGYLQGDIRFYGTPDMGKNITITNNKKLIEENILKDEDNLKNGYFPFLVKNLKKNRIYESQEIGKFIFLGKGKKSKIKYIGSNHNDYYHSIYYITLFGKTIICKRDQQKMNYSHYSSNKDLIYCLDNPYSNSITKEGILNLIDINDKKGINGEYLNKKSLLKDIGINKNAGKDVKQFIKEIIKDGVNSVTTKLYNNHISQGTSHVISNRGYLEVENLIKQENVYFSEDISLFNLISLYDQFLPE